MKKLFLLSLIFNSFLLFAQDNNETYGKNSLLLRNLRLNIQANVLQNFSLNDALGKKDFNLGNTFSAGLELVFQYNENMNYGVGAFYQSPISIDSSIGKIGMIPIYAFIDFPLIENKFFPIQFSTQFGYGFLLAKDGLEKVNNGIYHAFGITTVISKYFQLKFLYAHNYGKVKLDSYEYSLRKENLTLALYYKF
ncbi:MAG: hypothetical protein Q8M94_00975 [Ignavibacteria bacterium]|nr:hypothetical protein [Ignavibacteria bacterium]